MFPFLAFVLFVVSVVLHELGHALQMRAYGIEIEEFGIGYPTRLPSFKIPIRWFGQRVNLAFHPLLLAAYVRISGKGQDALEKLEYIDEEADINGAGVIANIIFCAFCIGVSGILTGRWVTVGVSLLIGLVCWKGRKILSRIILPLLSVPLIIGTTYLLSKDPGSFGGPVAIVQFIREFVVTLPGAFVMGGAISLSLALTNCLPVAQLDIGKTVLQHIDYENERLGDLYVKASSVIFPLMLIGAVVSDIIRLMR